MGPWRCSPSLGPASTPGVPPGLLFALCMGSINNIGLYRDFWLSTTP